MKEFYETDGKGEYRPGMLMSDRVGAWNHYQNMDNIKKAEAESPNSDPPGTWADTVSLSLPQKF